MKTAKEYFYYIELVERAETALTELISSGAPHADFAISARSKIRALKEEYEDEVDRLEYIPGDDKED